MQDDFPPATLADWRAAATAELRGRDPAALQWRTRDGIRVPSLATADDLLQLPHLLVEADLAPAELPRGETVVLSPADVVRGLPRDVLADSYLDLDPRFAAAGALEHLLAQARAVDVDPARLRGSIRFDPIGDAIDRGAGSVPDPERLDALPDLLRWIAVHLPGISAVRVQSAVLVDLGATPALELGAALASMLEYVRRLRAGGVGVDVAAGQLSMQLDVGVELLGEIGKLRAARFLWAKIVAAFGPLHRAATQLHLLAATSRSMCTLRDQPTNLMRTTLGAVAACVAGAESTRIHAYDLRGANRAQRLAHHQLRLLHHEAQLQRVVDPLAGAPAIELLTDRFGRAGWEWLQRIEQHGGLLRALADGTLHGWLQQAMQQRQQRIARREQLIIGTNAYCADPEPLPAEPDGLRYTSAGFDELCRRVHAAGAPAARLDCTDASPDAQRNAEFAANALRAGGFRIIADPAAPVVVRCSAGRIEVAAGSTAPLELRPGDDLIAFCSELLVRCGAGARR